MTKDLIYRLEYGAYDEEDLLRAESKLMMSGIVPTPDRIAEHLAAEDAALRLKYRRPAA